MTIRECRDGKWDMLHDFETMYRYNVDEIDVYND